MEDLTSGGRVHIVDPRNVALPPDVSLPVPAYRDATHFLPETVTIPRAHLAELIALVCACKCGAVWTTDLDADGRRIRTGFALPRQTDSQP